MWGFVCVYVYCNINDDAVSVLLFSNTHFCRSTNYTFCALASMCICTGLHVP